MDRVDAQLPNNAKGWSYFALTVLFIVGLLVTVFAYEQHLADDQFIGQDELKQNLQQLASYSAEAAYLSQYLHKNSAPQSYVSAYAASLEDASNSINEKLSEHPHGDNLDDKVAETMDLAQSLSSNLDQLSTEPVVQLDGSTLTFQQLADATQKLEQTL